MSYVWLRIGISEVSLKNEIARHYDIYWTDNFIHNLIESCTLEKNDIELEYLDNYILDFWSHFTVSEEKAYGYEKMIGNDTMTTPSNKIKSSILNLPLPFYFTRKSDLSIPIKKHPFEVFSINYKFRTFRDLLILKHKETGQINKVEFWHLDKLPKFYLCETYGNYIIGTMNGNNLHYQKDDLIETFTRPTLSNFLHEQTRMFLNFGPIIKAIFYGCRNIKNPNVWSVYHTSDGYDPIKLSGIKYDTCYRTPYIQSDYYSFVQPYFHGERIPSLKTGYHMYSFGNNLNSVDIQGTSGIKRKIFNFKSDTEEFVFILFGIIYKKLN